MKLGIVRAGVDDAGRAAQAEQDLVRATLDVDAVHVERVPRNVRDEEVAGVVGRGQTADTLGALGIAEVAGIFDAGAVA